MNLKKNNKLSTKFNLKGYVVLNLDNESKKELQQIQGGIMPIVQIAAYVIFSSGILAYRIWGDTQT